MHPLSFLLESAQSEAFEGRRRKIISNKVFVGNLSYEVTREELIETFGTAGRVIEAKIPTDRATGRPRGFAFVEFQDQETAEKSIEMLNGTQLRGRPLRVNLAENRPPRPEGQGGGFAPRGEFPRRDERGSRPGGGPGGPGQRPFAPRSFGPPPEPDVSVRGFPGQKRRTFGKGRDFEKRKRDEGGRPFDRKRPKPVVDDSSDDYDE